MEKDFNSLEYKRSRGAYKAQCTVEYLVTLLASDAFLAKLLSSLGIKDSLVGIISSFVTLACVVQAMSIFLVRARVSTKKLSMTLYTVSMAFFMLLYLVPFIPIGHSAKTLLVIISVLAAYGGSQLISSLHFKWANSFVDPAKRADYSATKEMISLFCGMAFTIVIGFVTDKFESMGNLNGAFLFIASGILVLNICHFICLAMIKKDDRAEWDSKSEPISVIWKNTVGKKEFRSVMVLAVMWSSAVGCTVGFLGVFKTKDLLFSVFAIQIINIVSNLARVAVSKPFGRYSDRTSYAKGFKLALYAAAGAFFVNMFTSRSTRFLIAIHTLLYNCSLAGINQNSFNITYSYVDSKYITHAMAIKTCVGGLVGFCASLMGGKILEAVQNSGNMVFGINLCGQQLLSGISCAITVAAIIYIKTVIEKQIVIKQ